MSPVRIIALLGLALMLAGLAAAPAPDSHAYDSHAYVWLTGQCFHTPAPPACHRSGSRFHSRHYDI